MDPNKAIENMMEQMYSNKNAKVPDLLELTEDLLKIIEFMLQDKLIELRISNNKEYKRLMHDTFPEQSLKYYGLMETITNLETKDISPLLMMLDTFKSTSNNKLENNFTDYQEEMARKFIYPQYGGKDNYMRIMTKEIKKQQKNKFK